MALKLSLLERFAAWLFSQALAGFGNRKAQAHLIYLVVKAGASSSRLSGRSRIVPFSNAKIIVHDLLALAPATRTMWVAVDGCYLTQAVMGHGRKGSNGATVAVIYRQFTGVSLIYR